MLPLTLPRLGGGDRIRTGDLRIMSPTWYQLHYPAPQMLLQLPRVRNAMIVDPGGEQDLLGGG